MNVFVPNTIHISSVEIPPSKSYAQRALIAAVLSTKTSIIVNAGSSDDVVHLSEAIKSIGATVFVEGNQITINPRQTKIKSQIHCGESGLATRLLASVVPVLGEQFHLTGSGSLLNRSMKEFEEFLPKFGVQCKTLNGFLPLDLRGKLTGGNVHLDASKSSQYLSGLLMALPCCELDSIITVSNLTSKPYIDVTLEVMTQYGVTITNHNYSSFVIKGNQEYVLRTPHFLVEGDYSAASTLLVLGAISDHKISIKGLQKESKQADRAILTLLEKVGAKLEWKNEILEVQKNKLLPFFFDANDCPDLIPALVVLAAACRGTSTIKGALRLVNKESNRALVLQKEFSKLNLKIDLEEDFLLVHGAGILKSGMVDSNNDHRIAMAGAIAACLTESGITVSNAEAVSKSYPTFWDEFKLA